VRAEHWIYTVPLRIRSLFRRGDVERELDEELRYHVEELTALHVARGMDPERARTAALRAVGGIERRKEESRSTRRVSAVENVVRDVRYALRMLRRTPGFTATAVLTLAVGIGANTAIFTVVNAVLLRPLPYGDPAGLVVLRYREYGTVAPAPLLRWKAEASRSFLELGAAQYHSPTITGRGDPEQVEALSVDPDVMSTLHVRPLLGRLFRPDEAHDGNAVVVLGFDFWQRRLGGDAHILGQTLTLDGVRRTVIGVMPRGFRFAPFWATGSQLWMPLSLDGQENDWEGASLRVFGRLRPGVSLGQAQAEMTRIGAEIGRAQPKVSPNVVVVPLHQQVVGDVRGTVWVLFAAVALVLLIACANVTHLQLLRAAARDRETAMRLSLGASRGRLVQQSLTESLILSVMGAILGLGIAAGGVRALVALSPPGLPRIDSIHFDPRVFCYLLLAGVAAGLVSGVVPALGAARIDPNHALKESGRSGDSRRRRRAGATLVVSECAMAVVLLIGAGLLVRSFAAMVSVDSGFDPRHVLSAQVAVRGTAHDPRPLRAAFYTEVIDRIGALPGVEAVSATNHLPLHGDVWQFPLYVAGRQYRRIEDQPRAFFRIARPGYFRTMGIPMRRGRDITTEDMVNRNQVVVIDESMARENWPAQEMAEEPGSETEEAGAT
jgi:predicted permease